ncbi:ribosomal 40S subunit protein S10A [Ancistrocladus abbreviatus]
MAASSISAIVFASLPLFNSSGISNKPERLSLSLPSSVSNPRPLLRTSHNFATKIFAAPEVSNSEEIVNSSPEEVESAEIPGSETLSIAADAEKMAPKQKIRIKLRSYWVPLIEDSCKQIMDAARTTSAKTMGPVPLPTKKRIYCVLKSPHVNKDARFHFEIRTHQRLIDILYPTAQTIDSLMQLDLPAGVDVEVKL